MINSMVSQGIDAFEDVLLPGSDEIPTSDMVNVRSVEAAVPSRKLGELDGGPKATACLEVGVQVVLVFVVPRQEHLSWERWCS